MTFPHYFDIAGLHLHPHPVLEVIAYSGGFQLYLYLRRRHATNSPPVPLEQNLWILVGAVFGALVGSKLLAIVESFPDYWAVHLDHPEVWLGGKTIVGGLLGGWAGVELAKRLVHVPHRTGDLYVLPLAFGMAVGRIGCFLTGLSDHTYGTPTSLPWAVDFGDHIPRHPTQLYEALFIVTWGALVWLWFHRTTPRALRHPTPGGGSRVAGGGPSGDDPDSSFSQRRTSRAPGTAFRLYVLGYLAMRLTIEFIKPTWKPYGGLSAIQLASLLGIAWCMLSLARTPIRPAIATAPNTLPKGAPA